MNHALFETGRLFTTGNGKDAGDAPWAPHPKFAGVWLKHLVRGADTGGGLSCHMVRLEPGACLESHVHDAEWELHEVVAGSGTAGLGGREAAYAPGCLAVIPRGEPHAVRAGGEGLVLFAKFFPAAL